jgi:Sjoegren syndrome nuclear autoantigen 1
LNIWNSIMSQQGAALQNYNNELVKCTFSFWEFFFPKNESFHLGIEDLCGKRDELQRQIFLEEEDKHKYENEIRLSSEKLARINENLAKKITARTEFDRTISETEAAYMKILESSQTLLNVIWICSNHNSPIFFVCCLGTQKRITFTSY